MYRGHKLPYYLYTCGVDENSVTNDQKLPRLVIQIAGSASPLRYELKNNKYCLTSDSSISIFTFTSPISGLTDTYNEGKLRELSGQLNSEIYSKYPYYDYPSNVTDIKNGTYYLFNDLENKNHSITWQEIYSNCDMEVNGFKFHNEPFKNLKDQIEVKLTPEFTVGMDRTVPGSAFSTSEDYWMIDITNNSPCNIQFKCYIVPATGDVQYVDEWSKSDGLKEYAKGIPIDVNTDDFIPVVSDKTVWMLEKNQWIYSKETENQEEYQKNTPYLVNKPTSCFFLASGSKFSQMIKWNQLNLNKNQPYQLFVTACECPYDKASDIHISLASDDYSQSYKHIIKESYYIISNITFSVKNPLTFDPNEKYGDVIPNTGRIQVDNDYWKVNAIEKNGEIEIRNEDYVNGWRVNPDGGPDYSLEGPLWDISLDDFSLDNVKSIINGTQAYFQLVSIVMNFFPKWMWLLILFGLTSIIVIAIFKFIRG